jgi:hypothetical protein
LLLPLVLVLLLLLLATSALYEPLLQHIELRGLHHSAVLCILYATVIDGCELVAGV